VKVLCLLFAVCLIAVQGFPNIFPERMEFLKFQHLYRKTYKDQTEWDYRFEVFKGNLKRIEDLNARKNGATYGITQFADLTQSEFKNLHLMKNLPPIKTGPIAAKINATAPNTFDWRTHPGVVTPVYNQGQCGSCWAFSATENIESRWALAGHKLTELSMQQIVDCDTTDYGCDGGWPYNAYEYVKHAGGLDPLRDYPYTAMDGTCVFKAREVVAKVTGWQYVTQNQDETQMVNYLVQHGALSVCVDASEWSFYTGGTFSASSCGTSIDHCVDAIGYNLGGGYWIIRNSWGTSWGISGYMHLQYGQDACAVAQVVTSSIAA